MSSSEERDYFDYDPLEKSLFLSRVERMMIRDKIVKGFVDAKMNYPDCIQILFSAINYIMKELANRPAAPYEAKQALLEQVWKYALEIAGNNNVLRYRVIQEFNNNAVKRTLT